MAEIAPDALKWLGTRISPDLGGVLSGIIGDRDHDSGYHRGRNYVKSTDYSRQLAEDKQGDGDWACAIDMSFSASKMKLYTGRLKAAADRNDPRLKYVREFYGTLNGTTVYGRTHRGSGDSTWESATSDKSHLWHIHISVLRQYANTRSVAQSILDVLMGKPLEDEDMNADQNAKLNAIYNAILADFRWGATATKNLVDLVKDTAWATEFGPTSSSSWVPKALVGLQNEVVSRDEAAKAREAANNAAIKGLTDALNKVLAGGASVDATAIINAVNAVRDETRAKFDELQGQLAERDAKIGELQQKLAAAAQAEAEALNS